MIVVDASVAVKWFVPEEGSNEADRLLIGSEKLFAPDLIRLEVAAGLTRKVRLGEVEELEIRRHCAEWPRMLSEGVISLSSPEQDYAVAVDLALQLKHPFQDCLYLALAQRLNGTLITADPVFIKRTADIAANVRSLLGPSGQA
jgi:predicted nucleic acid-binding protein